jgi:hypothetical protein
MRHVGHGHDGQGCGVDGCTGIVGPSIPVPAKPDFWVRIADGGAWMCSEVPPAYPAERPAMRAYRCAVCRKTFRLVELEAASEAASAGGGGD